MRPGLSGRLGRAGRSAGGRGDDARVSRRERPTYTFQQDGSRIRIPNPSGSDEGEARLIDLKTSLNVLVYDDAKGYVDLNKGFAELRPLFERELKAHPRARKATADGTSYRALGETRTVSGISCAMYERVVGGRADDQLCIAPWGGPVGAKEDFAWFEAFVDRTVEDVAGNVGRARQARSRNTTPGFALWESSNGGDGGKSVMEVVKLNRDPLPPALFQIPGDYKEFSRRLTASEHPHVAVPRPEDVNVQSAPRGSGLRVSGLLAIILAVGLLFALFVHAFILHLAANIVLEHPRFTQALVAVVINMGALIAFELMPLPPVLTLAFGAFGVFAGLNIAYGASSGRTVALFVVAAVITTIIGLLFHGIFHHG